jgi:CBS domain-containing protein
LAEKKIGALPVLDASDMLVGVISERDIIRGLAEHGGNLGSLTAEDLMTRRVVVCKPTDTLKEIMQLMSRNRIRHLPVVDDGVLRGIISVRDVVESQLKDAQLEVNVLRDIARAKT